MSPGEIEVVRAQLQVLAGRAEVAEACATDAERRAARAEHELQVARALLVRFKTSLAEAEPERFVA